MATTAQTPSDHGRAERRLREIQEKTHPGWTRLQWETPDGGMLNTQFRGPGGEIISRHIFRKRVASGEVATVRNGILTGPTSTRGRTLELPPDLAQAQAQAQAQLYAQTQANIASAQTPLEAGLGAVANVVEDIPEAKSSTRAAPGRASAADWSLLSQIALAWGTAIIAWGTQTAEVAMTTMEAQTISVPLGNIIQRSRVNDMLGRYVAGNTDYALLAAAIAAYGVRVRDQVRARAEFEAAHGAANAFTGGLPYAAPYAPVSPQPGPAASAGQQPSAATAASNGAAHATAATGGILGAASRIVAAQASDIVGYNPISAARGA